MKGVYSRKVIDHFRKPRNMRSMPDANGQGRAINKACSDVVHIFVKVEDGVLSDISFKSQGCVACIAAASMTTELAMGAGVEAAYEIDKADIIDALDGMPAAKVQCSMISPTALRVAIDDFRASGAGS